MYSDDVKNIAYRTAGNKLPKEMEAKVLVQRRKRLDELYKKLTTGPWFLKGMTEEEEKEVEEGVAKEGKEVLRGGRPRQNEALWIPVNMPREDAVICNEIIELKYLRGTQTEEQQPSITAKVGQGPDQKVKELNNPKGSKKQETGDTTVRKSRRKKRKKGQYPAKGNKSSR